MSSQDQYALIGFTSYNIQKKAGVIKYTSLTHINSSNCYLGLGNIYLRKGNINEIQNLFGEVQANIPLNELSQIILIGDFNVNLLDKNDGTYQFLEKSCKYLGLRIKEPGKDRNGAILDFIICDKRKKSFVNNYSDHSATRWKLEVNLPSR